MGFCGLVVGVIGDIGGDGVHVILGGVDEHGCGWMSSSKEKNLFKVSGVKGGCDEDDGLGDGKESDSL